MSFDTGKKRRALNPDLNRRIWKTENQEEVVAIANFLRICSSKLALAEIAELKQSDMKRVVTAILERKITVETLQNLTSDELYDLVIGQLRLF